MRTRKEVEVEIEIIREHLWYNLHQKREQRVANGEEVIDPEIWKGILKSAKRVEKKYGKENLWYLDQYELWMLCGKLSALRWLIGEEWDFLDI